MTTGDMIPQTPAESAALPEEARQALDALRAGQPAAADVFFLCASLTPDQRRQKVLLPKIITICVLTFGLAIGVLASFSDTPKAGAGILAIELVAALLLWESWVREAQRLADDPWRDSMICTPGYLLVISMGMIRLFELKNWTEGRIISRPGKYNRSVLSFIADSGETNLGFVDDAEKKAVDAFIEKLKRRIQAIANSRPGI